MLRNFFHTLMNCSVSQQQTTHDRDQIMTIISVNEAYRIKNQIGVYRIPRWSTG